MLAIRIGEKLPARIPLVEMRQLDTQDRRLDRVEPTVERQVDVLILHTRTVVAQDAHAFGHLFGLGDEDPAVPVGAEGLRRVKAEGGTDAEAAGPPALPDRARG